MIDQMKKKSEKNKTLSTATFLFVFVNQVLWIIPSEALRWFSIVLALCLSGSVLVLTFWPAVRDDHPRVAIAIMSAIVALHVLLAVGCKVIVQMKKLSYYCCLAFTFFWCVKPYAKVFFNFFIVFIYFI